MDEAYVAVARRAARAGAAVAEDLFRTELDVGTKTGKTDVVTRADREAQDAVVEVLAAADPDLPVVGEEVGTLDEVPEVGPAWIVDPIDGTNNYVRDVPIWATSVAAVEDGEPLAAVTLLPVFDDEYVAGPTGATRNGAPLTTSERTDPETFLVAPTVWWDFNRRDEYAAALRASVERFGDVRRFGCAQATLAMVADGALEATFTNVDANPWDTVAGAHLVERAGGRVTDVDGGPWRHDADGIVASNGTRHDEVLAAVDEVVAVARS